jgi:hypothetical protein
MLAAPVLGRQGFLAIARRQIGGEPRQDLLRPNSFGESLDPRSYDSSPQRRRGTPGTGRTVAVDIGRTTSAWHDPVCVWPWLRPSLMPLTWRKVPANAQLPVDGPECTGPAEWRTAISVSKMNIAFHDQIGHEMSIWSISRLCCTVRERDHFPLTTTSTTSTLRKEGRQALYGRRVAAHSGRRTGLCREPGASATIRVEVTNGSGTVGPLPEYRSRRQTSLRTAGLIL